jgi:pyrimidine-specific ribonucleoside hydrolase
VNYWLDVDTGIDDAVALLAAAGALEAERFAWVSTVAGNVALPAVVENTRRILAAAGREDVAVYVGADRPLVRDAVDAAYAHGASGLGSVSLSAATRAPAGDLRDLLSRLEAAPDASVTLVPTGPLTNIALLCRLAPALMQRKVARTVWMGGGRGLGNITVAAEFNAFADPEAAAIVLAVLEPVTVVDLNTTRAAALRRAEVADLGRAGSPLARLACRLLEDPQYGGGPSADDRVVVHDAVALLEAVRPGAMFSTTRLAVEVDLSHGPSYGATLVGRKARGPTADWPLEPVRERFAALLAEALGAGR